MLKGDFHMHTHYSPDSDMSPERLVRKCVKVGLNCIAVTDHNTVDGALRVREIADFTVIIGEEVGTADGEVTGLFLTETIPRGLSAVETVKRIKEQGGLVSVPHPFDRFRSGVITQAGLEAVLPYTDVVEVFNSRNNLDADNQGVRLRPRPRAADLRGQRCPHPDGAGSHLCRDAGIRRVARGL